MQHPNDQVFESTRRALASTIAAFEAILEDRYCPKSRKDVCEPIEDLTDALCKASQELMALDAAPDMLAMAERSLGVCGELLSFGKRLSQLNSKRKPHQPVKVGLNEVSQMWALIQRIRLLMKQVHLTVDVRPVKWPGDD